ncbi:hypothetical protein SNOG_01514 [Parastagonospora nodorum SN15]|uniref:Uncharacterized protein n=1 Tax=Phaeosphaeria nodorum (strain SN15 / ATCC MYA-4574 / FGSC 10173) TaxID=321614 RepID=Q0V3A0_PHANO|nr:hypothetical protein SNOG_01514 [Parastagonospora nodorum SN15]EAT91163.1 hypothetical protein SNOG_01514 [Parastagonospora nodorum SN15]
MGAIGRNCGEEYTDGGVYKKQCWVWDRRGEAIIDMRSALGTVSGSKAPLTTVHANLEAIVVRARRHQCLPARDEAWNENTEQQCGGAGTFVDGAVDETTAPLRELLSRARHANLSNARWVMERFCCRKLIGCLNPTVCALPPVPSNDKLRLDKALSTSDPNANGCHRMLRRYGCRRTIPYAHVQLAMHATLDKETPLVFAELQAQRVG